MDDTRIGTTIAGYRVQALLGQGGMSVVYLAEQISLGREVALKLLAPSLVADTSFRERFEHEAREAARTEHPSIVPVYDAGEAGGQLYIAMRYIRGRDLASLMASEGALSLGRTLLMLEQVAGALDAAHARGLVHRDVKPANVLVEEGSERAFVTDFGIAKRAAAPGFTRTGSFLGTVDYAAPEQIEGGEIDARTDVYALGCVLFECLSGQRPYQRDTEVAIMHAHLSHPPPLLTAVRPELPAALDGVIAKAMAKAKEDRHASCGELVAAARAAVVGPGATHGVGTPTVVSPRRPSARRPSRRALLAGGALAVLAVAAAVALLALRGGDSSSGDEPGSDSGGSVPISTYIPQGLEEACADADIYDGSTATAVCTPPDASSAFFPTGVLVALFTGEDVVTAYSVEAGAHGFDPNADTGGCTAKQWRGISTWVHGPDSPGGRRFCYLDGGEATIVWTHEASGEPDHENVLGVARAPAARRDDLLSWWSYWRHRIGRVTF